MKEQQKKLIEKAVWCAVFLFVLRCLFSYEELITGVSLYDLSGHAGEAVSVTIVLAVLYEKRLWRFNPFENTPKLAYRYSGILKSNYDHLERPASLIIKQTLLSVKITLLTDESKSNSLSATIEEILGEKLLIYCYINTPNSEQRDRSQIHYGTAIFSLSCPTKIEGQYYTDRKTAGDMVFVEDI